MIVCWLGIHTYIHTYLHVISFLVFFIRNFLLNGHWADSISRGVLYFCWVARKKERRKDLGNTVSRVEFSIFLSDLRVEISLVLHDCSCQHGHG